MTRSIPGPLIDLAWLAQKAVYLETVNGSEIYQVKDGWPRAVLEETGTIMVVDNAQTFEQAVQDPTMPGIYVARHAAMTEEMATRILTRNSLPKTIFWEIEGTA
jgi:hypothetical protein